MNLCASSATCRFADGTELGPFDVEVVGGTVTALVGPSGSGKSTIVRLLAGLVEPAQGAVTCDGVPVRAIRRRLPGHTALMSQHPLAAADPRMTLRAAVVSAAREPRGSAAAAVDVEALAQTVGLHTDLLDRLPAEVSGGQLQRAMLARALAQRPRFLLADEATAHLDPITAAAVARVLRAEADRGVGVLVVTHDHALADAIAETRVDLGSG